MIIEDLEAKGFRVSIFPSKEGEWKWTAGVYIGDNTKAVWVPNLANCRYDTYPNALKAVIKFCETYGKKKK